MTLPHRKRPPPIHALQLRRTTLPPGALAVASETYVVPKSLADAATIRLLPRILWRYGQSIDGLRYCVGRESSLPCTKSDLRPCLLTAIGLAHDANARERLCGAYVQLEVFIADDEFEIVRQLQDRLVEVGDSGPRPCSAPTLQKMAARREGVGSPAYAILLRIADQMLARRRELWGSC